MKDTGDILLGYFGWVMAVLVVLGIIVLTVQIYSYASRVDLTGPAGNRVPNLRDFTYVR